MSMSFAEHFSYMWWAYVVIFVMICLSAYFSDNIVCSSPWRIADTGVLQESHSDHLLLWAELTK